MKEKIEKLFSQVNTIIMDETSILSKQFIDYFANADTAQFAKNIIIPYQVVVEINAKTASQNEEERHLAKDVVRILNKWISDKVIAIKGSPNDSDLEKILLFYMLSHYHTSSLGLITQNAKRAESYSRMMPCFVAFKQKLIIASLVDNGESEEYEFAAVEEVIKKLGETTKEEAKEEETKEKEETLSPPSTTLEEEKPEVPEVPVPAEKPLDGMPVVDEKSDDVQPKLTKEDIEKLDLSWGDE